VVCPSGYVWCAAFDHQPEPEEIKDAAVGVAVAVPYGAVGVVVQGLEAYTAYDIYCYGEDLARPAHTTADRCECC
jgi:hypothetical protein